LKLRISVIIVNYNVRYFIEQCLLSVFKALENLEGEVIVVDNSSVDGSNELIRSKFPTVKLIANSHNVGFSTANNQGIEIATGEYVLLLNPDTLVEEDTFTKCIDFMDNHSDAGGLGVKMIDGSGKFLPESKRGLPTPEAAFYKIFGLSTIFPFSKKFGQYHLSFLDENETNEVDVLSGAFLLLRKSVLHDIGVLDETFFMYGEDIDISYRIQLGGYKNYYFPETKIIHYKGESTKKGSLNYVFVFYNAMIIFAKKHFSQQHFKLFSLLINIAIYFRAGIAILNRFIKHGLWPAIDFTIFSGSLIGIRYAYHLYSGIIYDTDLTNFSTLVIAFTLLVSILLNGGYDLPLKPIRYWRGAGAGTLIVIALYALLPESYRFSRAIILIGAMASTISGFSIRLLINKIKPSLLPLFSNTAHNLVIVADTSEYGRIRQLIEESNIKTNHLLQVSPNNEKSQHSYIPPISQLEEVIKIFKIHEVIFCSTDISNHEIIGQMSTMIPQETEFKIAPANSKFIIGSNSINSPGGFYEAMQTNQLSTAANKRNKRILDVLIGLFIIVISPLLTFIYENKTRFIKNMLGVIFGKLSFVGYAKSELIPILPKTKKGVLTPLHLRKESNLTKDAIASINYEYAQNYTTSNDLTIIFKNINKLDS